MKQFVLHLMLFPISLFAYSQNSGPTSIKNPIEGKKRSLDEFVWSLTHYNTDDNKKLRIDFDAINNWVRLEAGRDLSISSDGQYFAFGVRNGFNLARPFDSLIIQSTSNNWRLSFAKATPGFFSPDNKHYLFKDENASRLCIVRLGNQERSYIGGISSYKLPFDSKSGWFACQSKDDKCKVFLYNSIDARKKSFDSVAFYGFDKTSHWFFCQLNNLSEDFINYNLTNDNELRFSSVKSWQYSSDGSHLLIQTNAGLDYVNLINGEKLTIWTAYDTTFDINSLEFDKSGNQVVFVLRSTTLIQGDKKKQDEKSIWYWKKGMNKAVSLINNQSSGIDKGLRIEGSTSFTNNSHYIQFALQPIPDTRKASAASVSLDVWSYSDTILQSTQEHLSNEAKKYIAVVDPESGRIKRLETNYKRLKQIEGDYAIILQSGKDIYGDRFWEKDFYQDSCWVMSLKEESIHYVGRASEQFHFQVSPGGKYLVFSDYDRKCNYYSFNLQSGQLVNISPGVRSWQFCFKSNIRLIREKYAVGTAGWLPDDEALLVYDNYDIWQLDPKGKMNPINITNGYGQKHRTLLAFMNSDRCLWNSPIFSKGDTLILRSFNRQNKYNGYYRLVLGTIKDPDLLFMGPYFFEACANLSVLDAGMHPLKASDVNLWIVKRQTVTDAPNYFLTRDFKSYERLTNLEPHKNYNWLTAELHTFKQLDGTISRGVLYKPENFDPKKKYPLIIPFYGDISDQLYQYPTPGYLDDPSPFDNPAWMVSQGFLLFTPDVCFTDGQWGPSVVNAIDGAARYLSRLPYIDAKHIGACGHSNSGTTAYYLLTHSHLFAAMSVGAGTSDVISRALSLYVDKKSELEAEEIAAYNTGLGDIWENKLSWLDQTSILSADNVTSPLLMFHCEKDWNPIRQAIEMFISLRRLNKSVWWLQYDKGNHVLFPGKDQQDFTIRTTQFYDHYLKGAPAPFWMTGGIPFILKGIEARYELDPAGSCGKDCVVCKAWREQFKRGPELFFRPVEDWKLDKDIQIRLEKEVELKFKKNLANDNAEIIEAVKKLLIKKN